MSMHVRIRNLVQNLKRFFNLRHSMEVEVLRALHIVVPYGNALHRIVRWTGVANDILCDTTGHRLMKRIPGGEIWIPEQINVNLTTGTTARFTHFSVLRKDESGNPFGFHDLVTAGASINVYRGIEYGENLWLYPEDEIYAQVSTSNAGDKGQGTMMVRILMVGDDF